MAAKCIPDAHTRLEDAAVQFITNFALKELDGYLRSYRKCINAGTFPDRETMEFSVFGMVLYHFHVKVYKDDGTCSFADGRERGDVILKFSIGYLFRNEPREYESWEIFINQLRLRHCTLHYTHYYVNNHIRDVYVLWKNPYYAPAEQDEDVKFGFM